MNTIRLTQLPLITGECEGKEIILSETNICYYNFGEFKELPKEKVLIWSTANKYFQLETDDKMATDTELAEIVGSLH